ncbi:alpha/beta fold hydrolase [Novosphingobium sp. FSY-8]|uniref:Alpha/beta fold hydrolase n=1 Tax=Novosphingobium ovatum TaxID=1908523 RepID=A0ABW9XDB2_9SPHN|nr:alpha/beta hydrolase [Novosphingobium ovatum]NBC36515.1 alpha/beta fold hydrolase [Novosphingobium ovatum]
MADYVLVHGAWDSARRYEQLAGDLRAAGHGVAVVHLAGLGSRKGELHGGITLSDHADDVCAAVEAAGFDRFVLVGHSYGGMVITMVATRLGGQIDALVYLDAFLPGDGQSLWDITGPFEHAHYIDSQKFTPGLVAPIMGTDPGRPRHPLLTLTEAVRFTGEEARVGRRVYVWATGWSPSPFGKFADVARHDPAWEYHEVATSHYVMNDQPEATLAILLGCAA